MSRFLKLSQTIWHCQYHIVWVPKYRYRVLSGGIAREVKNCIRIFSGHISGYHISSEIKKEDFAVKGVTTVLSRVKIPGFFYFQNKMEPVALIGVEPPQERKASAFWKKIIKGWFIKKGTDEILVSESLTKSLGVVCGDRVGFSLKPGVQKKEFQVVGIYKTGISQLDIGISFCDTSAINTFGLPGDYPWDAAIWPAVMIARKNAARILRGS